MVFKFLRIKIFLVILSIIFIPSQSWAGTLDVKFQKSNTAVSTGAAQDVTSITADASQNYVYMVGTVMRPDTGLGRFTMNPEFNGANTAKAEENQKGPAADRGWAYFGMMNGTTGGGGGTLTTEVTGILGSAGDADETFTIGFETATMGTQNRDWFLAEDDDSAAPVDMPTSLSTTYASVTFTPIAGHSYLVIAVAKVLIDVAGDDVSMDIYDGSSTLATHIRNSEHTSDEQLMFGAALLNNQSATSKTLSVRVSGAQATTGDHYYSSIFIIRLNYYDAYSCTAVNSGIDRAIDEDPEVVASTSLTLNETGDVVAFFYGSFSTGVAGSHVSMRARQDATTLYQITEDDPDNGPGRIGVWATNDIMPLIWFDVISGVNTSAHTYDLSYERNSTGGAQWGDTLTCAWSVKTDAGVKKGAIIPVE